MKATASPTSWQRPSARAPSSASIDWQRRFDHMQQHTGQHLLSAVFEELAHLRTVSFHLGADSATIDLEGGPLDARMAAAVEARANQIVWENRPVHVVYEDAAAAQGLRKPSGREGTLRIVSIDRLDRSACGGTHVRATGEIGAVLLRKLEKVRQTMRVEFLCGGRAIARARADYEACLAWRSSSRHRSTRRRRWWRRRWKPRAPARNRAANWSSTWPPTRAGNCMRPPHPVPMACAAWCAARQRGSLEELRALAQNFTAQSKAVFVAALEDPPSVLLAVSEDAGMDAGKLLKAALAAAGGRGGGASRIAQGSVPDIAALEKVLAQLGSSPPAV